MSTVLQFHYPFVVAYTLISSNRGIMGHIMTVENTLDFIIKRKLEGLNKTNFKHFFFLVDDLIHVFTRLLCVTFEQILDATCNSLRVK